MNSAPPYAAANAVLKEFAMKKTLGIAVAALVAGASLFAEGLSVNGYIRSGISIDPKGETVKTGTWLPGDYFGGGSRLRLNINYDGVNGGATFRYQKDKSFATNNWFDNGNIKWAMGYAKFLDGKIIAEAGKLVDTYTSTGGWEDGTFGDNAGAGIGARVVVSPVDGLFITASASDIYLENYEADDDKVKDGDAREGDLKFNEKLFGFTAKYATDAFFVTGGVHLAKSYYASFGLTAVDNLTLVVEAFIDDTDDNKIGDVVVDDTIINLYPWVEYTGIENLTLAALGAITIVDDSTTITITPAVSYALTDVISLAAESTITIPDKDIDPTDDTYAVITPSVTFAASKKASATVFASLSTDTDQAKHSFGAGVKYAF